MKNRFTLIVLLLLTIALAPQHAFSEDKFWIGDSGSWFEDVNWDPFGVPITDYEDSVFLTSDDAVDRTVYYEKDTNSAFGYLTIDATGTGSMTFHVSKGIIGTQRKFIIGDQGTGKLVISGGLAHPFFSGMLVGTRGTVDLIEGEFGNPVGGLSVLGTVNQAGGRSRWETFHVRSGGQYNLIDGQFGVAMSPLGIHEDGIYNQSGGQMEYGRLSISGIYNLSGGTLNATSPGGVRESGIFNYSGGELVIGSCNKCLFNSSGTVNLSGEGTRTIMGGTIINNGTWNVTNTTALYTGTFTHNGAYISGGAVNTFEDLVVDETGYLDGDAFDYFQIMGDFNNHSKMKLDWVTEDAGMDVKTGLDTVHDLYLAGVDFGAVSDGYDANFAWGSLSIEDGNILRLFDGNDEAGAALYLGAIKGAEILDGQISNIFGVDGLNIYYLGSLSGNSYLEGLTYDITDGGQLIPINNTLVKGTIGTEFTIYPTAADGGFGTKKGKVFIGTKRCQVLTWRDSAIYCRVARQNAQPGTYEVTVKPNGTGIEPIVMSDVFTVKTPEIHRIDPAGGSTGDLITIIGRFFGTIKGNVYWVNDTGKQKKCKISSWMMDAKTGKSQIKVKVTKRFDAGSYDVIVRNKVGADSLEDGFTIE